ncbi:MULTISPECIES: hypothetical protein [unclassified Streptomyces]|uniref:hypothetical protein n=1 Tax=unclassified Streptomyces TaxID=2593676 RepID=UPI003D8EEFD7
MNDEAITIRLTRDQAFVLSDWLYQVMFQSDDLEGIVRDRAVWSPIYAISGTLDKRLSEIFMPDYAPRLEAARSVSVSTCTPNQLVRRNRRVDGAQTRVWPPHHKRTR